MKKAILYLLLFSYTIIICNPVLPSLSDAIAHIFWYSGHMATVHYEHGKYHVHYENVNEARKGYPQKDSNPPKSSDLVSEHPAGTQTYDFSVTAGIPTHFPALGSYFPGNYVHSEFRPPRA